MKTKIILLSALAVILTACASDSAEWAPAGSNIKTRWATDLTPQNAHQEYPRPQMIRNDWACLNGLWDYAISPSSQDEMPQAEGKILVPFCVESSLSGVGRTITADDAIWYSRTFRVPRKWRNRNIMLNFEAVDWDASVWVNGKFAGNHTGGFGAFAIDITQLLNDGHEQTVTVKVKDATDNDFQPVGKQTLHPGGIRYTAVSGIWQSVWMEPVGKTNISEFLAEPDIDSNSVFLKAKVAGAEEGDHIKATITGNGKTVESTFNAESGCTVDLGDEIRLWSPDDPYLYDIELVLLRGEKVLDSVKGYTAMRKISICTDAEGHKRMALNGQPLFQFGPLDQGWWPDGLYTAPSDEAMRYDLEFTKECGFNMIRKHVKVEPSTWYRACDELGILVWQDMPSFAGHSKNYWAQSENKIGAGTEWPDEPVVKQNFYKEWSEIIDQRRAFPCIVVWVPFNEAWGQFDTKKVADFTKTKDASRLVNPASGGNWLEGHPGDIIDSHHYPEPAMRVWDPEVVAVLGEYGGIGMPVEGHVWQIDRKWGYVQFDSVEKVTDEYVRFAAMIPELIKQGCSAAVYTQTTDVEGEVNGLLTYDRKIKKVDAERVAKANRDVISSMKQAL